ncbi:B1 protein [Halyomorpha halys]|uniref:Odorant-binding protein 24 n=1 Tax=Halyomorpha halys TaxID=286706 RepID=A0A1L2JGR2_HALHY|nr:uncharacterized protein LOC106678079 [Halyomorpha halys]AOV87041.1 odorant-binding protein 24 [Halyomorpha halys]KAE8572982.1 Odorant-binding protein 24 [Halyomorpha halys]
MRSLVAVIVSFAIITSSLVLIQCQEEDIMEKKTEAITQCTAEHNVSKEAVKSISINDNVPNDPEVKCWLRCIFEKLGVMKEGQIDWERCKFITKHCLSNEQDKAKVDQITEICKAEVPKDEKDECQLAYSAMVCKMKNWKNFGLQ